MPPHDVFHDCTTDDYFSHGCSWPDFDFDDAYFREHLKLESKAYFTTK